MKRLLVLLLLLWSFIPTPVWGYTYIGGLEDVDKEIEELRQKIEDAQSQERSLNSEIKSMDQKIRLTELQITETTQLVNDLEIEINELSGRIEDLESELSKLSNLLINRIVASYKAKRTSFLPFLFSSGGLSEFLNRTKYITLAQEHDRQVMTDVQYAKVNFSEKKELREEKKVEQVGLKQQLVAQQKQLDTQKKVKENLLIQTKNDEVTYQRLLAAAEAELAAIQGVISGEGAEKDLGNVNEGEKIATIIPGASCNSSGSHLHFIVAENGNIVNPFSYLRGGVSSKNCSTYDCPTSEGDSFNPSGSWRWPIQETIQLNQGYGVTWAVRNTWVGRVYSSHNGIDIESTSSMDVYSVKSGKLYKGTYSGSNGCRLPYARVQHSESNIETYYLHVY